MSEIFKNKGSPAESKNYRGISLVQLLAKLFDFILLNRFKKWFIPADGQTAYQPKLGCADHVFMLRCMTQYARKYKKTLFLIAIDFDGAFDRVSRSLLIRKLCKFGAGTIFTACVASIYMSTDNVIFRDSEYITYKLFSGIKQGLPLSPLLFLFYINDIFDFFSSLYEYGRNEFEALHLLIHADDLTMIAHSRQEAISKLQSLLQFCDLNKIIPQYSKCEFVVINGTESDREPLPFGSAYLQHATHIVLLGSHLTSSASVEEDLKLHLQKRHPSVIKFYNFIRSNKSAPLKVKLKVLKACVVGSLLHNCETFGDYVPKDLETTYFKLLKSCVNVRSNTPNYLVLLECGFLPIKAVIYSRQLKFYKRFKTSLQENSHRYKTFQFLLGNLTRYLKHYETLAAMYNDTNEITTEYLRDVKSKVYDFADNGKYKFYIYVAMNPNLSVSPFIDLYHPSAAIIIQFRLGSHYLPIETGRWRSSPREERLCTVCGVLGDERHAIYECSLVIRDDIVLNEHIHRIWDQPDIFKLFERLRAAKFL